MCKICVFAGTTEGRELVEFLCEQPISVTACVATEYGETLLPHAENLTVSAKRLDQSEMVAMLSQNAFDLVVDATHPYAEVVTENIAAACAETGTEICGCSGTMAVRQKKLCSYLMLPKQ